MENKEFDKIFRDAFEEAEEMPSPMIWDKIESQLDAEEKIIPISKRRKAWIPYAAAAAVVIGLGTYFIAHNSTITEVKTNTETSKIAAIENVEIESPTQKTEEKAPNSINPIVADRENHQLAYVQTEEKQVTKEKVSLEAIDLPDTQIELSNTEIDLSIAATPVYRQVTEIEDIKPLIEPEEESETMLASTSPAEKENSNIISNLINTISDNVDKNNKKEIRFYADDEGFIGINIINSIAKNRNKKRK